jgi:uncharacterized membrane protein
MRGVPVIAVSLWLGAMLFFAFVVAPAAFGALEREAAGRFVSAVFPRYYLTGAVLGAVALLGCIARGMSSGWTRAEWLALSLVSLMLALTLYAWIVVLPAAHAARSMRGDGPGTQEAARFARLHRLSSALNGVVMLAGIALVVTEVTRR